MIDSPSPLVPQSQVGPGMNLYGFCNGYFGRGSYDTKRIVAIGSWGREGWIVAEENGALVTATGNFWPLISNWLVDPGDE